MMKISFKQTLVLVNVFVFLLGTYGTNNLMANISSDFAEPEDNFIKNKTKNKIFSWSAKNRIQDISDVFSGSLDLHDDEGTRSYEIEDWLDLSSNFHIGPYSLKGSDNYSASLMSDIKSLDVIYYMSDAIIELVLLPISISWSVYRRSVNDKLPRSWVDYWYNRLIGSFPSTDRVSYYRSVQMENVQDMSKLTVNEPYFGMYKETRNFSYNLLNKYYSKLGSNESGRKNIYIFISNSPSIPIKIYLEALQSQSSIIKNKKIRHSLENSVFVDIPFSLELLNKYLWLRDDDMFYHFSKYIDLSIIQDNNLIFVDLAWDGVNVGSFIRNFRRYMDYEDVQEHALYVDIHTFFPEGLRSSFLNELSTLPNVDVQYSNEYFSFLMKNVFFSMYDNTLLYFIDLDDFGDLSSDLDSSFVLWEDTVFLPLDPYAWYKIRGYKFKQKNNYSNFVRNGEELIKRPGKEVSLPYQDFGFSEYSQHISGSSVYSYISNIRKGVFTTDYRGTKEIYNCSFDWIESVRSDDKASPLVQESNVKSCFIDQIQKDSLFTKTPLCQWLFTK